jgi:putative ubiquitin-RnfH superfamily antitoxin RatB of RatAB toxin-antitoxin module
MNIEIIYALPESQKIIEVQILDGATCKDAIMKSQILETFNLNINKIRVGIFSNEITLDHILKDGDRIEIYRPLTISPIEARRHRAEKKRKELNLKKFGA